MVGHTYTVDWVAGLLGGRGEAVRHPPCSTRWRQEDVPGTVGFHIAQRWEQFPLWFSSGLHVLSGTCRAYLCWLSSSLTEDDLLKRFALRTKEQYSTSIVVSTVRQLQTLTHACRTYTLVHTSPVSLHMFEHLWITLWIFIFFLSSAMSMKQHLSPPLACWRDAYNIT